MEGFNNMFVFVTRFIIAVTLGLGTTMSWAVGANDNSYFDRSAEGWFWYDDPIIEETVEEPKMPTPEAVSPPTEPAIAVNFGPTPLSSEWIRLNIQKYLDAALDNPSSENVQAFLYLQRITMDKANAFSDASSRIVLGNPDLDESYRRPMSTKGVQSVDAISANKRDSLTAKLAKDKGIFFFYRSDCPYCHNIAPVVAMMRDLYGVPVKAISIDGKSLPGPHFVNYAVNSGQAEKLRVTTVPALYLADLNPRGGGEVVPIGQGVMAMPEIKQRMIIAAVNAGWLSEDEFEGARPYFDQGKSFAELMQSPAFQDLSEKQSGETNYVAPSYFLEAIKDK